jgi:hypothetical protein
MEVVEVPSLKRKAQWLSVAEMVLLICALAGLSLYGGDWAIFLLRHKPQGTVRVERYLVVPLKGKKTEYDDEGERDVPCAQALFPQGAWSPCWYLHRHPIVADPL